MQTYLQSGSADIEIGAEFWNCGKTLGVEGRNLRKKKEEKSEWQRSKSQIVTKAALFQGRQLSCNNWKTLKIDWFPWNVFSFCWPSLTWSLVFRLWATRDPFVLRRNAHQLKILTMTLIGSNRRWFYLSTESFSDRRRRHFVWVLPCPDWNGDNGRAQPGVVHLTRRKCQLCQPKKCSFHWQKSKSQLKIADFWQPWLVLQKQQRFIRLGFCFRVSQSNAKNRFSLH